MSRRAATITQADIARALRALVSAGGGVVEVRPDGTMLIRPGEAPLSIERRDGPARDIVL